MSCVVVNCTGKCANLQEMLELLRGMDLTPSTMYTAIHLRLGGFIGEEERIESRLGTGCSEYVFGHSLCTCSESLRDILHIGRRGYDRKSAYQRYALHLD